MYTFVKARSIMEFELSDLFEGSIKLDSYGGEVGALHCRVFVQKVNVTPWQRGFLKL